MSGKSTSQSKKKKTSQTDLEWLQKATDKEIDYSDAPETDEEFWKDANVIMPATGKKIQIALRLDKNVLDWYKKQGPGYQTRIQRVLEAYMRNMEKRTG